jgi:hypothetical protein
MSTTRYSSRLIKVAVIGATFALFTAAALCLTIQGIYANAGTGTTRAISALEIEASVREICDKNLAARIAELERNNNYLRKQISPMDEDMAWNEPPAATGLIARATERP